MQRCLRGARLPAFVVLAGLLTHCGKTPPAAKTVSVSFVTPANGAKLTLADNKNPAVAAGSIQINVQLTTQNASDGSPVTLTVDGVALPQATVASNAATVSGIVLTGSASGTQHALSVSVKDSGGNGTGTASSTVTVTLAPGQCMVTISPANGSIFNESGKPVNGKATVQDEDLTAAGMQAKITATLSAPCGNGTSATLTVGTATLTGTASNGQIVFDKVALPDTLIDAVTNPTDQLSVTVTLGGGETGTSTVNYVVDSLQPTATILVPATGAMISANPVTVSGTTTNFARELAAGETVAFQIVDQNGNSYATPGTASPALANDGSFSVGVTLVNGANSLAFQASTPTGNVAVSTPITVTLASACTVTLSPLDGTLFNQTGNTVSGQTTIQNEAGSDGGIQAKITATVGAPCNNASPATLTVGQTTVMGTVTNGTVVFDHVALTDTPIDALTNDADRLTVTVSVGPQGGPGGTGDVHYIVDSVVPTATITAPVNGQMLTGADDVDPSTPGIQINVVGTTTGFTRELMDNLSVPFQIVASPNSPYATPVVAQPTLNADGTFTVEVTLNDASDPLTFAATSPTGNTAQSNTVTVSLNAVPTISITKPTAGQLLNAYADLDPVTPGMQTEVDVSTTAQGGSTIVLCSTVASPTPPGGGLTCPANSFPVASAAAAGSTIIRPVTLGEGDQSLTASVTDSGGSVTSAAIAFSVHSARPVVLANVAANTFVDGNGLQWLNASNVPQGGSQAATSVTVTLDSTDQFVTVDAGVPVTVSLFDLVTQSAVSSGVVQTDSDGGVTATIAITLADGPHDLEARVTDIWGNPNYAATLTPVLTSPGGNGPNPADLGLDVKTSLPTCAFVAPSGQYWNVAENGGVSSGTINLPVTLSASNANAVDLSQQPLDGTANVTVNAIQAGSALVTGSSVDVSAQAGQGPDALAATVTDPAGNPAATCTGGVTITVDTVPPTVSLVDTGSGQSDGGADYYTVRDVPVTITTSVLSGNITINLDGVPYTTTPIANPGPTAAVAQSLPNGAHALSATVIDPAGNSATSAPDPVFINAPGCSLVIQSPVGNPVYFNGVGAMGGQLQTSVTVYTSDCPGTSVTFTNTPSGGSPSSTPLNTDPITGLATFQLILADGASGTFQASITSGGTTTTTPLIGYQTKLTAPTVTSPSPAAASLLIVSNSANPNVGTVLNGATLVANTSADTTNAHASFSAQVGNLGPISGNATLHLAFGVATQDPPAQQVPSNATSVTFAALLPPDASGGTATLTVTDFAGNAATVSWSVSTSVIPPNPPSATLQLVEQHRATVGLNWTPPLAADGTEVSGYDLRWTTASGPATLTDAQFFALTEDPGSAALAGSANSYNLTKLPPFNTYAIAFRSVDAAGNRSEPIAVQTQANFWNQVTLQPTVTATGFGYRMTKGDFNGDGMQDLAIADPNKSGPPAAGNVFIVPGQANLATLTVPSTPITNGTVNDWFGYQLAAGDFTGAGVEGLAISSPAWPNGTDQGRVDIYLGSKTKGLSGSPSIEIQGNPTSQQWFGATCASIGDVDGDGLPDLFIAAPLSGTNQATVAQGVGYIFYSSSLKKQVGGSLTTLSYTNADITINGHLNGTDPLENFGWRWGATGIGNGYFVLPASGVNKSYVFSAAAVKSGPAVISSDSAAFTLTNGNGPEVPRGLSNFFGMTAISNSFSGGSTPDLAIATPLGGATVSLYTTSTSGVTTTPYLTLSDLSIGGFDFGWAMDSIDLNLDGKPDLIVGPNDSTFNTASIFINQAASPYFNATADGLIVHSATNFGYVVTAGSYDNSGNPDLAVSTFGPNVVILYY